jgi:hypothetical protein
MTEPSTWVTDTSVYRLFLLEVGVGEAAGDEEHA